MIKGQIVSEEKETKETKNTGLVFTEGKTPRNELELPTLHFIVVDQWVEVIGEKAIFAWLKLYSWCNRDDKGNKDIKNNKWEQATIPTSMGNLIKRLGVGRDTFYNQILKPLWNVGLIDIEEYSTNTNTGLKPLNIIVYKYPQNQKSLEYQPLESIRDYNKDYSSEAKTFSKNGGRPKKDSSEIELPLVLKENYPSSEIELPPSSEMELPLVPKENYPSSEIGHNNIFKSFNSFKSFKEEEEELINNKTQENLNDSNEFEQIELDPFGNPYEEFGPDFFDEDSSEEKPYLSLVSNHEIKSEQSIPENSMDKKEESYARYFMRKTMKGEFGYSDRQIEEIYNYMDMKRIEDFNRHQLEWQHHRIINYLKENRGKSIHNFGQFFVEGLLKFETNDLLKHRYLGH